MWFESLLLETKKDRIYFLVKDDDKNIGVIDLTSLDYKNKTAEIGLYSNPLFNELEHNLSQS